jgi:predicted Zn-dependent protease
VTRRAILTLLAGGLLSGCAMPKTPGRPLAKPAGAKGYGPVLFIPMGRVDENYIKTQARYFKEKLGLDIAVLKLRDDEFGGDNFDTRRKQVDGVALMESVIPYTDPNRHLTSLPEGNFSGYKVIVLIINRDLYDSNSPELNFVFSMGMETRRGYRVGLVSMTRLEPAFYRQRHQSKIVRERLRKLLTKQLGRLYYSLPDSPDPSSVMYRGINSIGDVDRMGEGF